MPRRPRVVVEGAVYHVYNRFARGEAILASSDEAERFVELVRHVRDRDDLTVLAWCVMSNHYHLAVRIGPVPLARSLGFLQSRFAADHNRRHRSSGPVWQGRYKAKIVTGERYLMQLIAYIHLNPVSAGLVPDPAEHTLSGHRELLGRRGSGLVDVDGVLRLFGPTRRAARASYVSMLDGVRHEAWRGAEPGQLPWWAREADRPLDGEVAASKLDALGRSCGLDRVALDAVTFVRLACQVLEVDAAQVLGGRLDRATTRLRSLIAGLAIERWRVRAGQLAGVFGRRPEVISRWAKQAGELRRADPTFAQRYEALDVAMAERHERLW